MIEVPCDDPSCECCHPENRHSCQGPPAEGANGDTYTCLECGVTWTCRSGERPPAWPEERPSPRMWWSADQPVPNKLEIAARKGRR